MEGLGKFREAFKEFSYNYVIIGGTACDLSSIGSNVSKSSSSHFRRASFDDIWYSLVRQSTIKIPGTADALKTRYCKQ